MKNFFRTLALALALGVAIQVIPLAMTGCATNATAARKGFTTLSNAAEAVKTAMLVFNDRYKAGQQTEEQRTSVLKAYAIYQHAALQASVDFEAGNKLNALQMINDAALPLLDLIASFKPPMRTGAEPS